MRPIARQSVRLAQCQRLRSTSRPRSPCVHQKRTISASGPRLSEPRPPNTPSEEHSDVRKRREDQGKANSEGSRPEQAEKEDGAEAKTQTDNRRTGLRKTLRQRRQSDVPKPPPLPDWFLKHNVELRVDDELVGNKSGPRRRVTRWVDRETGHTVFTLPDFSLPQESDPHHESLGEDPSPETAERVQQDERTAPTMATEKRPQQPHGPGELHSKHKSEKIGQNFFGFKYGAGGAVAAAEAATGQERPSGVKAKDPDAQHTASKDFDHKPEVEHATGEAKTAAEDRSKPVDVEIEQAWTILEIEAAARAAMSLSQGAVQTTSFAASRVDMSLHCPDSNAHYQMDKLIQYLAKIIHADVIRLDANDFADLSDQYVGQSHDSPGSFSTLGYDVFDGYQANDTGGSMRPPPADPDSQDQDPEEQDEEVESKPDIQGINLGQFGNMEELRKMLYEKRHELSKALGGGVAAGISIGMPKIINPASASPAASQQPSASKPSAPSGEYVQWDDARLGALLDSLLEAGKQKRASRNSEQVKSETMFAESHWAWRSFASCLLRDTVKAVAKSRIQFPIGPDHEPQSPSPEDSSTSCGTIVPSEADLHKPRTLIHVRDLKDIRNSRLGDAIVRRLVRVVQKRRRNGEQVLIIGTSAQEVIGPADTLIDDAEDSPFRGLVVQPKWEGVFSETRFDQRLFTPTSDDHAAGGGYKRVFEINARHIDSMVRRLSPQSDLMLSRDYNAQKVLLRFGLGFLSETVLALDDVQRLVLIAIGLAQVHAVSEKVEVYHLSLARIIMTRSDRYLREAGDPVRIAPSLDAALGRKPDPEQSDEKKPSGKARIEELKKQCNSHETKLLSGVKDPGSIKTAFKDVHAAKETTEALKTLTSLSLLRPDAFKYGVLASDRLPGLLLYGPPGTGKTLLAKAVAKESRATVLEVSGAQIYEKYVGEGEKMVNAVFTLARKLSPCVVFIDEADALFGTRSSAGNRNTHREIINQFLRGWDGMDDHGVFMMVATNRPFDLDDAVLRRLPRRLLVDLPLAKDRQSILGIHLGSELLAPSVDLAKLSEQTAFYSGSDLKNLCVSAALAAVREENELAESRKDDKDFKLPEMRTLEPRHFDKAMAEVSASISEDMSSLKAIRKFDEQYGDRRERRKKSTYGFGMTPEGGAADENAARVRQGIPPPP